MSQSMIEAECRLGDRSGAVAGVHAGRRREGDYVVLTAEADHRRLTALMPPALVPTGRVTIYAGWIQEAGPGPDQSWGRPFHEWGVVVGAERPGHSRLDGSVLVRVCVDDDLWSIRGEEYGGSSGRGRIRISPSTAGDSRWYDYTVEEAGEAVVAVSVDDLRPIPPRRFPFARRPTCVLWDSSSRSAPTHSFGGRGVEVAPADTARGRGAIEIGDPALAAALGELTGVVGYFGRCAVTPTAARAPFLRIGRRSSTRSLPPAG